MENDPCWPPSLKEFFLFYISHIIAYITCFIIKVSKQYFPWWHVFKVNCYIMISYANSAPQIICTYIFILDILAQINIIQV